MYLSPFSSILLKSGASNESIKNQLIKNRYHLGSLQKDNINNITYQSNEDKLYILTEKKELGELNVADISRILLLEPPLKVNLDSLFNPSEFLVSPFNNTDRFIKGEYFLTDHQKQIKESIVKIIEENEYGACAISGKAGTGKTLLVYDIAKEMSLKGKKVLIVHCGKLSDGHERLRDRLGIDLITIKFFSTEKFSEKYNLIIFDEAQRIRSGQLNVILENKEKSNYLFSYDKTQTLSHQDGKYGSRSAAEIFERIKNHFNLTENIRTNREISSFIKRFVDKKDNVSQKKYENISIQYFESMVCIGDYVKNLEDNGWIYISYTPKGKGQEGVYQKYNIYSKFPQNAHDVIGQEFDKVVVVVGENFLYKETGELTYNISEDTSVPYLPHKMLFQAITRVRKELKIVIVNNPEILERCLEILSSPKKA